MDVGDNYIKTAGLHLVDGRDFRKDSETDYKESIIITENLARKFGWDKPLGKEIIWMDTVKLYVIGVVKIEIRTPRGFGARFSPRCSGSFPNRNIPTSLSMPRHPQSPRSTGSWKRSGTNFFRTALTQATTWKTLWRRMFQ